MSEVHQFGVDPITCHAFNSNGTKLILSPNNNEVHIYRRSLDGNKWTPENVLNQHDLRITSIDWAPNTNRIVTCSADRNAYVWSLVDNNTWKPTLVLLRINRAATCVRWSPKEDKFAVGSGAKLISVCYFEESNDWWVSKHIKKPIKSTVTCIDWHPNNVLLAAGGTDFKSRVFSAFIKDVDKNVPTGTSWPGKHGTIGSVIAEFTAAGWVHDVKFSPDGQQIAWVSHDSSISVADASKGLAVVTLKTRYLPYLTCIWSSNQLLVAAGHDCSPMLFKYDGELRFVDKVDKTQRKQVDGFNAMKKFQNMDRTGTIDQSGGDSLLDSIHQNTINEIRILPGAKGGAHKISTVALDGKLVVWDLKSLEASLSGLRIM